MTAARIREVQRATRRDQRRDELKRAAIEVFHAHGYHDAKVSQIVQLAGVAQGTFYLYFEGKQPLFAEILSDWLTLVVQTVANWEPQSMDSREVLREELVRVGMMLTQVMLDNRKVTAIFFTEALVVSPDFRAMIREFYDTLGTMLAHFNRVLCERRLIGPMNHIILAYMTVGMVERVIMEHIVHGNFEQASPREVVEHLVTHFMAGTTEAVAAPSLNPADPA